MRRPLKPFVTEYKPSTRRQLAAARHPHPTIDASPPSARPGEGGRFDAASRPEDSYEAALRAADALFSPQKDKPPQSPPQAGREMTDPDRPQDAVGRGRILRVIDEPPPGLTSEMMSELERQRAPKRRGRKPGSKNRPKMDKPGSSFAAATSPRPRRRNAPSTLETSVPGVLAHADAPDDVTTGHAGPGRDRPGHNRLGHNRPGLDERVDGHRPGDAPGGPEPVAQEDAGGGVTAIPSRERRRFSWVRTKLKPGQEWKRRLPKVCW